MIHQSLPEYYLAIRANVFPEAAAGQVRNSMHIDLLINSSTDFT